MSSNSPTPSGNYYFHATISDLRSAVQNLTQAARSFQESGDAFKHAAKLEPSAFPARWVSSKDAPKETTKDSPNTQNPDAFTANPSPAKPKCPKPTTNFAEAMRAADGRAYLWRRFAERSRLQNASAREFEVRRLEVKASWDAIQELKRGRVEENRRREAQERHRAVEEKGEQRKLRKEERRLRKEEEKKKRKAEEKGNRDADVEGV